MSKEFHLVIFRLADEYYAVDILSVSAILKTQAVTPIPQAADFIVGVTTLRGMVVPVIDLRKRLGLQSPREVQHKRIIVVSLKDMQVGMLVDEVSEVQQLDGACIDPPSPLVTSLDAQFIRGIARYDQRLVILVDLEHVLSGQEQNHLADLPAAA